MAGHNPLNVAMVVRIPLSEFFFIKRGLGLLLLLVKINSITLELLPQFSLNSCGSPEYEFDSGIKPQSLSPLYIRMGLVPKGPMISFSAMDFSKYNRSALKVALLSIIPGLGQLFNRRRDKALAFFAVNLANAVFFAVLMGCRLPFLDYNSRYLPYFCNAWEPGSVPFTVLQGMLFTYIVYAQYDAYKDACAIFAAETASSPAPTFPFSASKSELGLSETACGSYIVHLSAFLLVGLLIVLRVCPDIRPPEENQICLSFELNSPEPGEQKAKGDEGKLGEESNVDESAHLKDRISESVKASSASAEMNAAEQESGDNKPAAEETETVASKEIIAPFSKQSPTESASNGAVVNAMQTTKTPVEEAKTNSSSPANIASINAEQSNRSASPNQQDNPSEQVKPNNSRLLEASKKIAQLPPAPINAGFLHTETTPNTVELIKIPGSYLAVAQPQVGEAPISSSTTISGINIAAGVLSRNASAGTGTAGDGTGSAPSMLGFMDSKLSSDPAMRLLWSQMSSNLSKTIKAQPLNGEGTAVVNFTVDQRGRISSLNTDSVATELDESLVKSLQSMPSVIPPAKQFSKLYFQVKASNLKTGTVVALEINSEASAISPETLSDFKYQVNLQSYLKGVKKAIYTSWKPPVQEGVKPVMVGFKVSTDGAVSDQHIVESSGDPKMDRAALNAALSVTQWSQPPAGTSEDLDVCMVLQKCKNCDEELKANR